MKWFQSVVVAMLLVNSSIGGADQVNLRPLGARGPPPRSGVPRFHRRQLRRAGAQVPQGHPATAPHHPRRICTSTTRRCVRSSGPVLAVTGRGSC